MKDQPRRQFNFGSQTKVKPESRHQIQERQDREIAQLKDDLRDLQRKVDALVRMIPGGRDYFRDDR